MDLFTCGIYPTRFPGMPNFRSPGIPPKTETMPWLRVFNPTIVDKTVVFPQPLAPKRPYLKNQ